MRKMLEVDGREYAYYPIDQVEGAQKLPYSLKVLLENILRLAPDEERARELSSRLIAAGCADARATKWNSPRHACSSKTSRVCPCSWISL